MYLDVKFKQHQPLQKPKTPFGGGGGDQVPFYCVKITWGRGGFVSNAVTDFEVLEPELNGQ